MDERRIVIDDLLLDPGNPRFAHSVQLEKRPDDSEVEALQSQTFKRFSMEEGADGEEDVFFVKEICDSMREIGFVPIDRPVVRQLAGSTRYLVIEGNRRIASAKLLRKRDDTEPNESPKKLKDHVRKTLDSIEVLVLPGGDTSSEETDHSVAVILGLRHHGSVVEWGALSKAYSLYTEYMGVEPRLADYAYDRDRTVEVGNRFSVKPATVRSSCETYVAYSQLSASYDSVKPGHFSLVQAIATNRTLTGKSGYFVADPATGKLEEESMARMSDLCQFADRDKAGAEKIIPTPQDVRHLARIVKESKTNESESVRDYSKGLLTEVETGKDVESAADLVKNFINHKKWAGRLGQLMDKQAEDLAVADFVPEGNALLHKTEVVGTFGQLRRVLDV